MQLKKSSNSDFHSVRPNSFSTISCLCSQTSPTLASNLYCLARYTDVQEKVYEEVQRVIPPTGPITPEMINSMSYLKAFVKETFR